MKSLNKEYSQCKSRVSKFNEKFTSRSEYMNQIKAEFSQSGMQPLPPLYTHMSLIGLLPPATLHPPPYLIYPYD